MKLNLRDHLPPSFLAAIRAAPIRQVTMRTDCCTTIELTNGDNLTISLEPSLLQPLLIAVRDYCETPLDNQS